jgi:ureidoacrylate peracid hydrolase
MAHQITWPASEEIRARSLNRFDAIDAARTALIVVDLQVGFVSEGFPAYCRNALDTVPNANRLAKALRAAGGLVVYTRHTILDDPVRGPPAWQRDKPNLAAYFASLEPGAAGHPLHPSLDVQPQDLVIDKVRFSAFLPISSTLDADLRARGIDTVIITGTVTNVCCESSARDAHMLNYKVFFISDATAAGEDEEHNAALSILGLIFADVRRTDEMLPLIETAVR